MSLIHVAALLVLHGPDSVGGFYSVAPRPNSTAISPGLKIPFRRRRGERRDKGRLSQLRCGPTPCYSLGRSCSCTQYHSHCAIRQERKKETCGKDKPRGCGLLDFGSGSRIWTMYPLLEPLQAAVSPSPVMILIIESVRATVKATVCLNTHCKASRAQGSDTTPSLLLARRSTALLAGCNPPLGS